MPAEEASATPTIKPKLVVADKIIMASLVRRIVDLVDLGAGGVSSGKESLVLAHDLEKMFKEALQSNPPTTNHCKDAKAQS